MHIAHINLAKGFRGGERQTLLLIEGLSEQFSNIYQTLIIRHDSPLYDKARQIKNLNIIKLKRPYILQTRKINNYDIVHAHEAKACHLAYFLWRQTRKPYIITRRMDRATSNSWLTRQVYSNCSHLISLSSAIEKIMLRQHPRLPHSIIPSMHADLPSTTDRVQQIRNAYPGKILVGNIGALVMKHKGQQYIIEAAKQLESTHPDIHFLILGKGKNEKELKRRAEGLSNISFLGFKENIGDYYQAFDIFLYPSLEEGLGSAILDAMATKLPIIATNIGGIPDIIRDRENGLLIPARDSKAIVNAILELLDDERLVSKLVKQGEKDVENYHPSLISQSYMKIYKPIVNWPNL